MNLESIVKIENHPTFVRLYLPSGDIEEVTKSSWESAVIASGSNTYSFTGEDSSKSVPDYDNLDTSDVEDVTNLSDGQMVPEIALSEPQDNAVIEGSDATYTEDEDKVQPEEVYRVIKSLGLTDFKDDQIIAIANVLHAYKNH